MPTVVQYPNSRNLTFHPKPDPRTGFIDRVCASGDSYVVLGDHVMKYAIEVSDVPRQIVFINEGDDKSPRVGIIFPTSKSVTDLSRLLAGLYKALVADEFLQQHPVCRTSVADVGFSVRTCNALRRSGITTVLDIVKRKRRNIEALPGLGLKSELEIREFLQANGLTYEMTE